MLESFMRDASSIPHVALEPLYSHSASPQFERDRCCQEDVENDDRPQQSPRRLAARSQIGQIGCDSRIVDKQTRCERTWPADKPQADQCYPRYTCDSNGCSDQFGA